MDTPSEHPQRVHFPWRFLIAAALIAFVIAAAAGVWFINRLFTPPVTGATSDRFEEYLPTVGAVDGILETATANVPETFTRTDSQWLFNVIPLGTTVSEIRVPAVYRYHINLYDPWRISEQGRICVVVAPQFHPDLPPAIDTARMEKSTSEGWLRFNGQENLDALERDITEELTRRADDRAHRDYVREACRQSIADLVRNWMLKEDNWRKDRFQQIIVLFPDEAPNSLNKIQVPPTVTLDGTKG
ncbi:MAG TPA: hypothetical protein VHY22_17150 [Chthoniobacteraceae bacterium]|jgi:hypothetical protein|nr:hypothetical protein [Chthoniobacteraceae bacterium]